MNIQEKLENYDLYDQLIESHGFMPYMRDYELIAFLTGLNFSMKVQFLFQGCIKATYESTVKPEFFSMDERLLSPERETNQVIQRHLCGCRVC